MEFSTTVGQEMSSLDVLSNQSNYLDRSIHRENEIFKNLQKLIHNLTAEIKSTEEYSDTCRENIKTTLNRQRIVEKSIESTNASNMLVEKLRCDLKKQVALEKIKTKEKSERLQNIINNYERLWSNYEAIYHKFPMVPERNNLKLEVKQLEIIVAQKNQQLMEEKQKLRQIAEIRDKQMKCEIIHFCQLMVDRTAVYQKFSALKQQIVTLQEKIKEMRKKNIDIASKVSAQKEALVISALESEKVPQLEERDGPIVSVIQSPMSTAEKVVSEPAHNYSRTNDSGKQPVFSSLEIPELELPMFSSPPRKQQRLSRARIHPISLFPEYNLQEREISQKTVSNGQLEEEPMDTVQNEIDETGVPATCETEREADVSKEDITNVSNHEEMGAVNAEDMETQFEQRDDMNISQMETSMDVEQQQAPEHESFNQPMNGHTDGEELQHLSQPESDDSTSERARMELRSRLTKSPDFSFLPRRTFEQEKNAQEEDVQNEASSQYFLNTVAKNAETNNEREIQPIRQITQVSVREEDSSIIKGIQIEEPQEYAVDRPGINGRDESFPMVTSNDMIAVSFRSSSPPVDISLAPTSPEMQAGPSGENQGFMFNFPTQSSSNIMSLFGDNADGGDDEDTGTQNQKKGELFNFNFDKKSKSSSFFKLF